MTSARSGGWVEWVDTRKLPYSWQTAGFGLLHRFDLKKNTFGLNLYTGDLDHAEGKIPLSGGKSVQVSWKKINGGIEYAIITPEPITINIPKEMNASKNGSVLVKDNLVLFIK